MSFKLSIGKIAITTEDMYSNEAIMAFHDKHVVEMLPEYIYYLFKYKNWDESSNKAVMGKTLNKATLSEIEICPVSKQKEIVNVLDKITGILFSREKEARLLDELIKFRFVKENHNMNVVGFWACGVLVIPFGIIGILFAIFKEKAAKFVSGFNSLSKEEQALYDKAQISRDIRNQCFIWSVIMLIGAILSYFVTPYMAILAFIIWLFLFFKDVHLDNHKAFEKYLLK